MYFDSINNFLVFANVHITLVYFFIATASDAKERQKWITHLRAAVNRISNAHIPSPVREAPSAPAASMTQSLPVLMATTSAGDHLEYKGPAKRTSFSKFFQSTKNTINR